MIEQNYQEQGPYFRIWTLGTFLVERRIGLSYQAIRIGEWGGSSYPRSLLKTLLCRPGRHARRNALMDRLWPDSDPWQAGQYLNTAASKLRLLLCPVKGHESLLITANDASSYELKSQRLLWVDADACIAFLEKAEQAKREGADPLPLVEEAGRYFARGHFLEQEESLWAHGRRGSLEMVHYRCMLWQAELYQQCGWLHKAETLLLTMREENPTDEDALCRLMLLLQQQHLIYKALCLYEETRRLLEKDGMQPNASTRALAERLRNEPQPIENNILYP